MSRDPGRRHLRARAHRRAHPVGIGCAHAGCDRGCADAVSDLHGRRDAKPPPDALGLPEPIAVTIALAQPGAQPVRGRRGDCQADTQADPAEDPATGAASHPATHPAAYAQAHAEAHAEADTEADSEAHAEADTQPPVAVARLTSCGGNTASFTSAGSKNGTILWNFGDGATSTLASPTHPFADGPWTIVLKVTGSGGSYDLASVNITIPCP